MITIIINVDEANGYKEKSAVFSKLRCRRKIVVIAPLLWIGSNVRIPDCTMDLCSRCKRLFTSASPIPSTKSDWSHQLVLRLPQWVRGSVLQLVLGRIFLRLRELQKPVKSSFVGMWLRLGVIAVIFISSFHNKAYLRTRKSNALVWRESGENSLLWPRVSDSPIFSFNFFVEKWENIQWPGQLRFACN